MTRNVTFVLCVAGLALGGCYDHRTVEEADISPIEGEEDAGVELPGDGDDADGDDGDDNGGENNGGEDNNGNGDEGPTDPGGMGPFGDIDCDMPANEIEELICDWQEGGGGMGGGGMPGGGFPGGGGPGGQSGGQSGGTTRPGGGSGGQPGGGSGFPGAGGGDPGEIIREIIENLDCEMEEPDFITEILCALTEGGGGFPGGGGGGFPGGGGNGFPGF